MVTSTPPVNTASVGQESRCSTSPELAVVVRAGGVAGRGRPALEAGGSLAGKDCDEATSGPRGASAMRAPPLAASAARKVLRASVSGTRSWGRDGPAMLGSTDP